MAVKASFGARNTSITTNIITLSSFKLNRKMCDASAVSSASVVFSTTHSVSR